MAAADEVRERRDQLRRPTYTTPELLATRPNQLWSWDSTKLKGPTTWTYYYLYVILDVFSRYVVGWMITERESAELAEAFIAATCAKEGICRDQLTLHADRGSAMTSKRVAHLLADLGVTGCPLGVPFAAARLERQSVLGGAVCAASRGGRSLPQGAGTRRGVPGSPTSGRAERQR